MQIVACDPYVSWFAAIANLVFSLLTEPLV